MGKILGAIVITIAIIGGKYCWVLYQAARDLRANSVIVTGIVMNLERVKTGGRHGFVSHQYHPVVGFANPQGEIHRFRSEIGRRRPNLKRGQRVNVAYNPITKDATIDDPLYLYGPVLLLLLPVFIGALVGIGLLLNWPMGAVSRLGLHK